MMTSAEENLHEDDPREENQILSPIRTKKRTIF